MTTAMDTLLNMALAYQRKGFSVIAVDENKVSIGPWKKFTMYRTTEQELVEQFANPRAKGIAIICGEISGYLEIIDIDLKYDLTGHLYKQFIDTIRANDRDLVDSLVKARTRSDGRHFIYRCPIIGNNQILARRPPSEEELAANPKDKAKVLIETRGRSGYFVVVPTPGYRFIEHDLFQIPVISIAQRALLHDCARSLNLYQSKILAPSPVRRIRQPGEVTPLDDYNERGDVIALLEKHGWSVVRRTPERTYLKRPGQTDKFSSGDFNHDMKLFSVFSTSTEFEPGRGYRPYAVYTMLECDGDFKEAVRRLTKEGYGQQPRHPFRYQQGQRRAHR